MAKVRTIRGQGNVSKLLFMLRNEKPTWFCENRERCDYAGGDIRLAEEMTCCAYVDDQNCIGYCALYYCDKPYQAGKVKIKPPFAIRVTKSFSSMEAIIKIQELT